MSESRRWSPREYAGVVLYDLPRVLPRLLTRQGWVGVCNRQDQRTWSADGRGVAVAGDWSSALHACNVFPLLGRWLMRRALADWPISFMTRQSSAGRPRVSFLIPHRGKDREPLLRLTLASILAQQGVAVECILVEQSASRDIGPLPAGVRYIHLPHPTDRRSWRKSWAYNVGAAAAQADILVCHDGDILVPEGYAAEICRLFDSSDWEVAHLQRFLFYLGPEATRALVANGPLSPVIPADVRQNWCGGTLAIRKAAYAAIGGFDERFVDWGGEDNEFFDRCGALKQFAFGYVPFIHLWHPPQANKFGPGRDRAVAFMHDRLALPVAQRIAELRSRQPGRGA